MPHLQEPVLPSRRRPLVFRAVAALALLVLAAGCGEAPTAPSHFAPFSQTDLRVGTGTEAVSGTTVDINYTLWLYSASATDNKGAQVETSVGGTPFSFALGANQVITGMNQGVTGMRVGGIRRLVIPPSLGYGGSRSNAIPPNATLLFEVELLSVTSS